MRFKWLMCILLLVSSFALAQRPSITGRWLLSKAEANGNIQEPYFFVDFLKNGNVEIMGKTMGSWTHDIERHAFSVTSEQNKYLNGRADIIRLTLNQLILEKDGIRNYYQKIYPDTIQKANKEARLSGTWKIFNGPKEAGILRLQLPDIFEFIEETGGVADTTSGTWMYRLLPNEESIVFVSFSPLRGKIILKEKMKNRFSFQSKGIFFTAKRLK